LHEKDYTCEKSAERLTGGLAQWRQLARRQFCANLNVILPQQVQWKPPLRQAAGTLGAMPESVSG